jgi:hypothetical protein
VPFLAIVYVDDHTADAIRDGDSPWEGSARTVGLFEFPNRAKLKCRGFCTENGKSVWVRSPRGFLFCGVCGSRHWKTRRFFIGSLFDRFGANILHDVPAAFRTPEGYSNDHADND